MTPTAPWRGSNPLAAARLPVADGDSQRHHLQLRHQPVADKAQVFRDAFRVLKPGGRLAVSDIATTAPLPPEIQQELALYTACVAGAASVDEFIAMLADAGFADIHISPKDASRESIRHWALGRRVEDCSASAAIEAVKPAN